MGYTSYTFILYIYSIAAFHLTWQQEISSISRLLTHICQVAASPNSNASYLMSFFLLYISWYLFILYWPLPRMLINTHTLESIPKCSTAPEKKVMHFSIPESIYLSTIEVSKIYAIQVLNYIHWVHSSMSFDKCMYLSNHHHIQDTLQFHHYLLKTLVLSICI